MKNYQDVSEEQDVREHPVVQHALHFHTRTFRSWVSPLAFSLYFRRLCLLTFKKKNKTTWHSSFLLFLVWEHTLDFHLSVSAVRSCMQLQCVGICSARYNRLDLTLLLTRGLCCLYTTILMVQKVLFCNNCSSCKSKHIVYCHFYRNV